MTELETIEGEVVEAMSEALEVRPAAHVNLFGTEDPTEVIRRATAIAETLATVLRKQNLISKIGKGEHVRVEGWTLLGTMLGVFPVCVWTRKVTDPEGWEARVEARTLAGAVVGAAEAECLRTEKQWGFEPTSKSGHKLDPRDDFALRSMAQTRATSKALRQPLGFVVTLAGFEATPAEEMPQASAKDAQTASNVRDPATEGFPLPGSWKKISEAVKAYGESTWNDWVEFSKQAQVYLFGEEDLDKEKRDTLWRVSAEATVALRDAVPVDRFPPPNREEMAAAWTVGLGEPTIILEGPAWRMSPDETDRGPKDQGGDSA